MANKKRATKPVTNPAPAAQPRPVAAPARPSAVRTEEQVYTEASEVNTLVFGRATYVWVGIGIALMLLGMALMAGGSMPSADVWDESIIYSFRRITLAPMVILAGLGVVTYAILKK